MQERLLKLRSLAHKKIEVDKLSFSIILSIRVLYEKFFVVVIFPIFISIFYDV